MIVSLVEYRHITQDALSYDGNVLSALTDAQAFVEENTFRHFDYEDEDGDPIERTETLNLHRNGRVYPSAQPVVSVSDPDTAVVSDGSIEVSGPEITAFTWSSQPAVRRVSVAYEGGMTVDSAPFTLKRLICQVAAASLAPSAALVPAGADSVTVGDVSVRGKNIGTNLSTSLWSSIRAWRRREL